MHWLNLIRQYIKTSFYIVNIVILFLYPVTGIAGAWPQTKGQLQLITTSLYYHNDSFYNTEGNKQSSPTYQKLELNPYIEYGLTPDITLGANIFLQHLHQSGFSNYGLGNSEWFMITPVLEGSNWIISAKPLISIPSPHSATGTPPIGSRNIEAQGGFLAGYAFEAFSHQHFIQADLGYRKRLGNVTDQLRADVSIGLRLMDGWMLLPQAFLTRTVGSTSMVSLTQSPRDEYELTKLQLTTVVTLSPTYAIQIGAFSHVEGKNTGAGEGVLIALWNRF